MPYGNITYPKSFNNNHRFTYFGLPLDNLYNELQFAFSINEQLLSSYNGNIIEVLEDDGGTTQEFGCVNGKLDTVSLLNFVGTNNGYIIGIYDQKTGIKTSIPTASQQIQIVNAGTLVNFTAKYLLEIPKNTALSISGIASCNRMKNLSLKNYIAFKGEKTITGYSNDYVFPINCNAGLMDFGITNGQNVFWYTIDNTVSTSSKPSPTLTNSGVSYLFASNFTASNIQLNANSTGNKYVGNLKDIPRITYYLNLGSCSLITGSLADLQGKITYFLDLYGCSLINGSLADLQGKITYLLSLGNCSLINGSLADLQGKITYFLNLYGCSLINGIYTPSTATNTPITFNIRNTGLSPSDVDNTLIACHALPKSGVTFTWTGLSRTSASDAVATALDTTYNWTFNPAL